MLVLFFIFRPVSSVGTAPATLRVAMRAGSSSLSMFYTYVLKSKKDTKLYIGFCGDLKVRLQEHQNGFVDATKSRRPLDLVYYEACQSKIDAIKREKQLKSGFGRAYLKRRLSDIQ